MNYTLRIKLTWNSNQDINTLFHENPFHNVVIVATIFCGSHHCMPLWTYFMSYGTEIQPNQRFGPELYVSSSWMISYKKCSLRHMPKGLALENIFSLINTLRLTQNGWHFKHIFVNENVWIWVNLSPKFVAMGPFKKIPASDQIMAWRRPGDKPLSEPMLVSLPTHICITRPQWVNASEEKFFFFFFY